MALLPSLIPKTWRQLIIHFECCFFRLCRWMRNIQKVEMFLFSKFSVDSHRGSHVIVSSDELVLKSERSTQYSCSCFALNAFQHKKGSLAFTLQKSTVKPYFLFWGLHFTQQDFKLRLGSRVKFAQRHVLDIFFVRVSQLFWIRAYWSLGEREPLTRIMKTSSCLPHVEPKPLRAAQGCEAMRAQAAWWGRMTHTGPKKTR